MCKTEFRFVLCPSREGKWFRLWACYKERGRWQTTFVGHVPQGGWLAAEHPERFVSADRAPRLASAAGDLRGIAELLDVRRPNCGIFQVEQRCPRPDQTQVVVRRGGSAANGSVAELRLNRGPAIRGERVAGFFGPISAYLAALRNLAPTAIPANEAAEYLAVTEKPPTDYGRAPFDLFYCPTMNGRWQRVYAAYRVAGEWQVCFVGHIPNPEVVADLTAEEKATADRNPQARAVYRDLLAIAAQLGVQASVACTTQTVCPMGGARTRIRVAVDDQTVTNIRLVHRPTSKGDDSAFLVGGLMGELRYLLRALGDLGYENRQTPGATRSALVRIQRPKPVAKPTNGSSVASQANGRPHATTAA